MNPALSELRDIHLPARISWWPLAPGWWLLLAIILLLVAGVYGWHRQRKRNRWRRESLNELLRLRQQFESQQSPAQTIVAELSILLRRVAISRFSRTEVAALNGDKWLTFLDRTLGKAAYFQSDIGKLLAVAPFAPHSPISKDSLVALFEMVECWLKKLPAGVTR